jgi:hypothetical protein
MDGVTAIPQGYGYLRIPCTHVQDGFLPVRAFYHPLLRTTVIDERDLLEASGLRKEDYTSELLTKDHEAGTWTYKCDHRLRCSPATVLSGPLMLGKAFTPPLLRCHDTVYLQNCMDPANDVQCKMTPLFIHHVTTSTERMLWHQRFGHPSDYYLYHAQRFVEGVPRFKHHHPVLERCPTGIQAKQRKEPAGPNSTKRATNNYQGLSIDFTFSGTHSKNTCRSRDNVGLNGETCYLLIVDRIQKCKYIGQEFAEDSKYVHNIIQSLTVGEDAEQWVKVHKRSKNGRTDFLTLVAHFTGEGNDTRRIGDAERLEKTLHYKDERAMGYQTFLAKTKHMCNIFEEVGEPKPESAKIRFLLDWIRSTELQPIVQAFRAGMTLDPNVYTFTTAANMIASQVTPKETKRSVSARGKESGDKINKEFLPVKKWRALSAEQQASIRAARDQNPDIKKKPQRQKSLLDKRDRKIKNLQKKVSALKRSANQEAEDESDNEDPNTSAGDAFGGREEKKQAKKRTKK